MTPEEIEAKALERIEVAKSDSDHHRRKLAIRWLRDHGMADRIPVRETPRTNPSTVHKGTVCWVNDHLARKCRCFDPDAPEWDPYQEITATYRPC
ncbi:hypothetical protein [Amycolatopsis minnesotensis]|uniref:Uncharacterized protein n=1 Tax=Amycolatopsis minnesotensis TaxID=337894 RepID=A0ABN2QN46_9PSEU